MSYNIKPQTKNQVLSHILLHGVFGFFMITLILNTIRLMREFVYRRQILAHQESKKDELASQQEELKYRLKRAATTGYIEERARELSLAKTNEAILIGADAQPKTPSKRTDTKAEPYREWLQVFRPYR